MNTFVNIPVNSRPNQNPKLLLENIRQTLARLEETLIFAFVERAQFHVNQIIYLVGAFPSLDPNDSLCGFLLHETERIHAAMRRYTSPDEHPFYSDLPEPKLEPLNYTENPLAPNKVNLNAHILSDYTQDVVVRLCPAGDDQQYGSSAVCDVQCLQAISRRVHIGLFVAESKYRQAPQRFDALIGAGDAAGLLEAVTHDAVEGAVIDRVRHKAQSLLGELRRQGSVNVPEPTLLTDLYHDWIIPLNKEVQVAYLLERGRHSRGV